MPNTAISTNLRRLRQSRNLTQQLLAEQAGLSRAAYRNIESGRSAPRVRTLQALASALAVPLERLASPVHELRSVRFRSNKRMRIREQIIADAGRWLKDFHDLEEALDDRAECQVGVIARRLESRPRCGAVAAAVAREVFGLAAGESVRDICGLLEVNGIKVGEQKVASHDFFGLSIASQEGGPAVIVNTWERISVERWIFTAAHELGHLILHPADYDVNGTAEETAHEAEANAFASAFLMPPEAFRREWQATCGLALVDRVMKVKRIFGVSYRTVLHRLAPDYAGPGNIWARFQVDYKRRHGRSLLRADEPDALAQGALAQDAFRASQPESRLAGEPDHLSPSDFVQDRLSRLVRQAVETEQISLGRGAEVLGLSLVSMRDLAASWVA